MRKSNWLIGGAVGLLVATLVTVISIAQAAASKGLAWDAVTTYYDGTPVDPAFKIVYIVYTLDGKQVDSTFNTSYPAAKLPADGCYYVKAGLFNPETNNMFRDTPSDPGPSTCVAPDAPTKKVSAPLNLRSTP
jgi:hypothetical protein